MGEFVDNRRVILKQDLEKCSYDSVESIFDRICGSSLKFKITSAQIHSTYFSIESCTDHTM